MGLSEYRMNELCECVACQKSGITEKQHGSSCCFKPNVTFRTKKENLEAKATYCSPQCEIKAFRLLKREPSLESMLQYHTQWNKSGDLFQDAETKKMIDDKLMDIKSADYTIDGMLLPNFVARKLKAYFDFFKQVIDMGFRYDKNDDEFINFIFSKIKKIDYQIERLNDRNEWMEKFLNVNLDLSVKISNMFMKKYTGMIVNIDSFKGFDNNKNNNNNNNNNNQDNNNKKQKMEENDED